MPVGFAPLAGVTVANSDSAPPNAVLPVVVTIVLVETPTTFTVTVPKFSGFVYVASPAYCAL